MVINAIGTVSHVLEYYALYKSTRDFLLRSTSTCTNNWRRLSSYLSGKSPMFILRKIKKLFSKSLHDFRNSFKQPL